MKSKSARRRGSLSACADGDVEHAVIEHDGAHARAARLLHLRAHGSHDVLLERGQACSVGGGRLEHGLLAVDVHQQVRVLGERMIQPELRTVRTRRRLESRLLLLGPLQPEVCLPVHVLGQRDGPLDAHVVAEQAEESAVGREHGSLRGDASRHAAGAVPELDAGVARDDLIELGAHKRVGEAQRECALQVGVHGRAGALCTAARHGHAPPAPRGLRLGVRGRRVRARPQAQRRERDGLLLRRVRLRRRRQLAPPSDHVAVVHVAGTAAAAEHQVLAQERVLARAALAARAAQGERDGHPGGVGGGARVGQAGHDVADERAVEVGVRRDDWR